MNNPQGLVAGRGAVWVTQLNEHVLRIDTTTPKPTAERDLSELGQFPVLDRRLALAGRLRRPEATGLAPRLDHARAPGAIPFTAAGYPAGLSAGGRSALDGRPELGLPLADRPGDRTATRVVWVAPHPISVAAGESAVWVGTQAEERVR